MSRPGRVERTDPTPTDRGRFRIDVHVPLADCPSRVDAALAAGGRLITGEHAPSRWVLADVEGNEACICSI